MNQKLSRITELVVQESNKQGRGKTTLMLTYTLADTTSSPTSWATCAYLCKFRTGPNTAARKLGAMDAERIVTVSAAKEPWAAAIRAAGRSTMTAIYQVLYVIAFAV